MTFPAKIEVVESLGAEEYVYFEVEGTQVESEELSELAADAGAHDVPGSDEGQVVAASTRRAACGAGMRSSSGSTQRSCISLIRRAGRNLADGGGTEVVNPADE